MVMTLKTKKLIGRKARLNTLEIKLSDLREQLGEELDKQDSEFKTSQIESLQNL